MLFFTVIKLTIFTVVNDSLNFTPTAGAHYGYPSWGDYDGDGYEDLAFLGVPGYLYHNLGGTLFVNVAPELGIDSLYKVGSGTIWGDYDNDGDLDVYKTRAWMFDGGRGYLLRNDGDSIFTNVSEESGIKKLKIEDNTQGCSWLDYDSDGWLDLYIVNYDKTQVGGEPDYLYHNNGDGTFTNVSGSALPPDKSCGRDITICDYDNDGDIDIFVSNYRLQEDFLYRNNGDGTFTNVANQAGVEGSEHTLGCEWIDYDNDGDFDLYLTTLHSSNILYRNNGDGTFSNVTSLVGVEGFYDAGGASWADYDNDGWIDVFLQNIYKNKVKLYHNNGDGTFTDVTKNSGITYGGNAYYSAWADYDNDGDMDLVVVTNNEKYSAYLYRNNGNDNHWFVLKLVGADCNRSAIGARVRIVQGERKQIREVKSERNMLVVHFGLGSKKLIDTVIVRWPCGRVDKKVNVEGDRKVIWKEGGEWIGE